MSSVSVTRDMIHDSCLASNKLERLVRQQSWCAWHRSLRRHLLGIEASPGRTTCPASKPRQPAESTRPRHLPGIEPACRARATQGPNSNFALPPRSEFRLCSTALGTGLPPQDCPLNPALGTGLRLPESSCYIGRFRTRRPASRL